MKKTFFELVEYQKRFFKKISKYNYLQVIFMRPRNIYFS